MTDLNLFNRSFLFIIVDQLAGVVGVEVTGGPDIPFHPGRDVSYYYSLLFN